MSAVTSVSSVVPSKKSSGTALQAKKSPQSGAKVVKKTTKGRMPTAADTAAAAKELKTIKAAKIAKQSAKVVKTIKKSAPTVAEPKRNYGLDADQIAEFKKEKSYNAYREGSSYWCVVEALHELGIGKFHSAADLIAEYVKVADKDALKNFKSKEKRNEATAQDWKGKILTNAYVCTRIDYGKRLRDIGFEVRYERTDDGATYGLFRLSNGKGESLTRSKK